MFADHGHAASLILNSKLKRTMTAQEAKKKAKKGREKADEGAAKKKDAPKKKGRVRSSSRDTHLCSPCPILLALGSASNEIPRRQCCGMHVWSE